MVVSQAAVPDEAWSPGVTGTSPVVSDMELPGYRDFVPIASGGDSTVYRARQVGIDRLVAIKVLAAHPEDGPAATRFQRELEITVRLGRAHPHIITVLDTQVLPDGRPCIVMDYHDLGSLHDVLRAKGPLPASAVIAVGTVVADALAFAHEQGILHRDVKPQNILVLPTSYVLADFGLARGADAGHTSSLERFSYRHAAPQVLDGSLPTVADDIYSLGSTLYTLLDGRTPFATDDPESDTALAYLRRVRTEAPRPMRTKGIPQQLLAIIDRCLAKQREDRFADAGSLRDALAGLVSEDRAWAPDAPPMPLSLVDRPPAPVARSAIERMPAEKALAADAVPTGIRPSIIGVPDPAPPDRRPRWPRLAVMAGIALLIGAALGLGVAWINARNTPPGVGNSGRPVPTFSGALPGMSGSPRITDPSIAAQIATFEDRGSSFVLSWTDNSGGKAIFFVVIEIAGTAGVPLVQVDAAETNVVVEGIDPARPYCVAVLTITDSSQAISPIRCTGNRPTPR